MSEKTKVFNIIKNITAILFFCCHFGNRNNCCKEDSRDKTDDKNVPRWG